MRNADSRTARNAKPTQKRRGEKFFSRQQSFAILSMGLLGFDKLAMGFQFMDFCVNKEIVESLKQAVNKSWVTIQEPSFEKIEIEKFPRPTAGQAGMKGLHATLPRNRVSAEQKRQ